MWRIKGAGRGRSRVEHSAPDLHRFRRCTGVSNRAAITPTCVRRLFSVVKYESVIHEVRCAQRFKATASNQYRLQPSRAAVQQQPFSSSRSAVAVQQQPFSSNRSAAAVQQQQQQQQQQPLHPPSPTHPNTHPNTLLQFDPYFNYRVTQFLTKEGFYSMWDWFDDRTWYPLGRIIGGTVYPVSGCERVYFLNACCSSSGCAVEQQHLSQQQHEEEEGGSNLLLTAFRPSLSLFSFHHQQGLIITAGAMYRILHALNIPLHVQEVRPRVNAHTDPLVLLVAPS